MAVSINDVSGIALPAMTTSENALSLLLSTVANGDTVTTLDLMKVQMSMASNSLTAEIASATVKQRKDAEENIIQKF